MHGLEKLVKKQIIRIDNHKWGGGVVNDFNDSSQDVHLHKVFKFNRKKGECSIRIPLNNNQDVSVIGDIPICIQKEIQDVLGDPSQCIYGKRL
ncbi:MAG: hypothetical protein NC038_00170 [Paludibacter sp.]|nr:hypothetical protein [Bacteroidales bacterium]MCM1068746.1 hypothetical protein [Prevotella sp.]MCM1354458.1 hypothetical protein [Bacteroides sp.]MCM1443261.1 hypothetical protein [Muribaculum sp.]MCM1481054.1 hypothetical protein [Paludibacter sp.]